ncbi:hypothetical protein G6L45_16215 [Agrobacterium rhizogenes]|nr:hypothetical protein [Rhizobium rhizogenes]NTH97029.1 hypothetical protein [Rhizobium rhizogenes]NTJ15215.1 hypothetical protein [Rhizobium rhizogenes]
MARKISADQFAFDFDIPAAVKAKPVALKKQPKAKMSEWQIEQENSRMARLAYRESLPDDDAGLLNRAWAELKAYDAAVRAVDYDGMVGAGNNLKAIGEHAFGMSRDEMARSGPPAGNGKFSCLSDAWSWVMNAISAENGEIPLFGQKARFEIEVAGCRVDMDYDGMFGICGGSAHVIDWEKPFFSETGYRSFQVCPNDFVIAAKDIDCKQWLERICTAQLTEGGKKKVKLVRAWPSYALQWRQSRAFVEQYKREELWMQWGPERHAEVWANHDARQADAMAQMIAEGIDPEEVWKTR